ncbi:MAG: NAD(P)H-hydrate epimerase [Candidatus Marinimicrobia bacterium]|jgi:NAD(P)H-hydrate epimerase|nr:NAD(P)H-hydrate epimerase [Candidatus Neomarinimicrobiota bacterium]MBT3634624.1 NAD(P)H-hydrate epimerase [Candidatus Neomarinimicrobiota bacterium]MBT3682746.1 NAD(P)H-hydrate epimerase [Candidatus Neomarinimicrobiota bacterium]MBT3759599.1 NAD(P)H-hydrate epimerase [Candidatus Neomarinimicrobiota bacterium]MBT3894529.1 NAD(P)H-hydrate epimerase [Candidatus Neomarinimicrobiota bacterium]
MDKSPYPIIKIPQPWITTEQMIEVDRLMIEEYGIILLQMMENAGSNLARFVTHFMTNPSEEILVFAGNGHNGGGGLTAARHLFNHGYNVKIILTGNPAKMRKVTHHQFDIVKNMAIPVEITIPLKNEIEETGLIIDAMIGYGLTDDINYKYINIVKVVNEVNNIQVVSLDAPTGLNTTTGLSTQHAIKATQTLTLAYPKIGLATPNAKGYIGELFVADISVPPKIYQKLGIEPRRLFNASPIIKINSES